MERNTPSALSIGLGLYDPPSATAAESRGHRVFKIRSTVVTGCPRGIRMEVRLGFNGLRTARRKSRY